MKPCKIKIRFGFLEPYLSKICYKHTHFIADHPWPFIIVPILITLALGTGYFFRKDTLTVYQLYTPTDGLGLTERENIRNLFPPSDGTYTPSRSLSLDGECDLIVTCKDGGNILRPEYRKAVNALNNFVMDKLIVRLNDTDYSYKNICLKFLHFCHTNPQIYAVDFMLSSSQPYNNLTFPTAQYGNRRLYIGNTLGGVKMDPVNGKIMEAKAWQLVYQTKYDGMYKEISQAWERLFEKSMLNYKDNLLDLAVAHSQSLELEIRRNSENITSKFVTCFFLLLVFALVCSASFVWDYGIPYIDWTLSKPTVAFAGLMGALMGVVTTIGLLTYCGYEYNTVVDAMPFVVLGVRLDNTFLMISAIHHTNRKWSAKERVSEAMSESAVSITITVLTDILSFAVGLFTDFVAVQLFSLYTVVAMTVTYLYQLTFLVGVLVLSLRVEEKNHHSLLVNRKTVQPDLKCDLPPFYIRLFCLGTQVTSDEISDSKPPLSAVQNPDGPCDNETSGTWISKMIKLHYAQFLMKTSTKLAALFLYLVYLALSIYGCYICKQGLEPVRLVVSDSYTIKSFHRLEEYFWKIGVQAQILFAEPGNLTDKQNRNQIFNVINKFANSDHGMGSEGVDFWLIAFKNFLVDYNEQSLDLLTNDNFYSNLKYFLSLDEHAQYRNDLHWSNGTYGEYVSAFRAMVGLKNFSTALLQIDTVDQFRKIAQDHPDYKLSTFQIMWIFVDQYEEVLPNTMQEIYGGISFMIIIAIFLIPSVVSSFWVVVAILSIDAGVVGFMTFWGINLDVISMITIIMSIGFSVDFTAHIAYSFVVTDGLTPVDKTTNALGTLAWPIIQGGASTTVGVLVLAGNESYVSAAFFKTVFLVIGLGLMHALIFLPVVLSVFSHKLSTRMISNVLQKARSKIVAAFVDRVKKFNVDNNETINSVSLQMKTGDQIKTDNCEQSLSNPIPDDPIVSDKSGIETNLNVKCS